MPTPVKEEFIVGEDSGRGVQGAPRRDDRRAGWIIGIIIVVALIVIAYFVSIGYTAPQAASFSSTAPAAFGVGQAADS